MLMKLLSQFGLPFLIKMVRSGLEKIGGDTALKATEALSEVSADIEKQKISNAAVSEANRHLEKMQELENELDNNTLNQIHQTIRQELNAEDRFVPNAETIINALVETTSLWSVALGVLGIQVVKSTQEKSNKK